MEDLQTIVHRARLGLPPGTVVSDEHLIISATPSRHLGAALDNSRIIDRIGMAATDMAGFNLLKAVGEYLAATPTAEQIAGSTTAPDNGEQNLRDTDVPTADYVSDIVGADEAEFADLADLFRDVDQILATRRALDLAKGRFAQSRTNLEAINKEMELAGKVREEVRRLSRVPRFIVGVLASIVVGLVAFQVEHNIHEHDKVAVASGAVQPGMKEYGEVQDFADDANYNAILGFSEFGAVVCGVAVWTYSRDPTARLRALSIVWSAKKARSSDNSAN